MQKRLRGYQTTLRTKSSKITHTHKCWKENLEPSNKRTAERTCRHPYNWSTPLWKLNPNSWPPEIPRAEIRTTSLASHRRKTRVKQFWGLWFWKRLTNTTQWRPGHTSTPMVQLKTPHEMEDAVPTSSVQEILHSPCQHLVRCCAQTTELKS